MCKGWYSRNKQRAERSSSLSGFDSKSDTQTCSNTNNIEFSASTGTDNTVTHCFVADASTSGNILFVGQLDNSKTIQTGDIFRINSGNISIELK